MAEDVLAIINAGKPRQTVTITTEIDMFDIKEGAIPYIVPLLRKSGRIFAGGNVVFKERLDALVSQDSAKINVWGNQFFDLADLCLTFEDKVKFQPDSPLLTGIRGVVETQDGLFVAVDAEYVARAVKTKGMKHFKVRDSETVKYGIGDNQRNETAKKVVLLRYATPHYVELNADQFNSVNVDSLRRTDMALGKHRVQEEIVKNGKVIYKLLAIYLAELVVPLVQNTFEYNKRNYDYDTNFDLYLASPPQNHGEMRALYVGRLSKRSRLDGDYNLGNEDSYVVGVASGYAKGATKK